MLLSAIEVIVRDHIVEPSASFWTSAELVRYMNRGIRDLYRSIHLIDKDHFHTVDATNVTLAISGASLSGVPVTVARVLAIEARDLTTPGGLIFEPRPYLHPDMQRARATAAAAVVANQTFYYTVAGAGAPIAAPTIYMAPKVATALLNLTLVYVPSLTDNVASDANPIPGESDLALIAWTIAYARAKEREDRKPDPGWLEVYETEKLAVLDAIFERQSQFGHKLDKVVVQPSGFDGGEKS